MPQPLDYSSPSTPATRRKAIEDGSGRRSFHVGIFCWCAIAAAIVLMVVCLLWPLTRYALFFPLFLIIFIQTLLAGYGLIGGCVACYFEGGHWRAIVGTILNALALCMVPILIFLMANY